MVCSEEVWELAKETKRGELSDSLNVCNFSGRCLSVLLTAPTSLEWLSDLSDFVYLFVSVYRSVVRRVASINRQRR